MFISYGYDISFNLATATTVICLLQVHPARRKDILFDEREKFTNNFPLEKIEEFIDPFGNLCTRFFCPSGNLHLKGIGLIKDSGKEDPYEPNAKQDEIINLPSDILPFLFPSRYCEVDSELAKFAWQNFGNIKTGWQRVEAVCNFVHEHVTFNYQNARANRTALETFNERTGVCRDFTHLAITLCRCLNIPSRYVTGYLGDIGVPPAPFPMDFSAWMEVYLGGKWYVFDPRHNCPRIGRIVIAHGRDASDVAIMTVFGEHWINHFRVITDEQKEVGHEKRKTNEEIACSNSEPTRGSKANAAASSN